MLGRNNIEKTLEKCGLNNKKQPQKNRVLTGVCLLLCSALSVQRDGEQTNESRRMKGGRKKGRKRAWLPQVVVALGHLLLILIR